MSYWLVKSEPESWSWDQQVRAGAKGTAWTGVRNHTAKQNLMKMKKGDRAFFYHSGEGKEFVAVDMKAVAPMPKPVTLAAARGEPQLADMALLKQSRLSVQPVTAAEWR